MRPYHIFHENDDPDIKKIKKVIEDVCGFVLANQFPRLRFLRLRACRVHQHSLACISSGAELHAGMALSPEVEAHRSGLHLLPSCREHEEEEPDCLQHGGGRDRVRRHITPRVMLPKGTSCVHPARLLFQSRTIVNGFIFHPLCLMAGTSISSTSWSTVSSGL